MKKIACLLIPALLIAVHCGSRDGSEGEKRGDKMTVMKLTSGAFEEGALIPRQHTCDGANSSPPLSWTGAPEGTKSFSLIFDDPDAPSRTWVHWVVYDLPADMTGLPENVGKVEKLDISGRQGVSDFGRFGYGGPCPPSGTHRYFFKLYALDTMLELSGRVSKKQLEEAMEGHVLESAQLVGRYTRQ